MQNLSMGTHKDEGEQVGREQLVTLAEARSKVYDFLAVVYLHAPTKEFINSVKSGSLLNLLKKFLSPEESSEDFEKARQDIERFLSETEHVNLDELLQKLSIDRTRLLRGVSEAYSPPPPYESVYVERMISGFATQQVAQAYAQAGLAVSKNAEESPDFIGVELDFMRALCEEESKEWSSNNRPIERLHAERSFVKNHLYRWIPNFCDNMLTWSQSSLYRAIAHLTKGWIILETNYIEELLQAAGEISS